MKPKFKVERLSDTVTLYLGDCREVLPTLGKVDADGIGVEYISFNDTIDNLRLLIASTIPQLKESAKRVIITSGNVAQYDYPKPVWTLAWITPAGSGSGPWGFSCWQPILCYGKDPYLQTGKGRSRDIIEHTESSEENGHPCPKPLRFMQRLLNRVTLKDELILDPFMGSGTTGVACVKLNRKFIGIEIEPTYFDIACKRLEKALKEPNLFQEPIKRKRASFKQTWGA